MPQGYGLTLPRRKLIFSKALSFSLVASSGTTSTTVTIPGTPTAGDLCIIWNYIRNNTSGGSAPSGFTELIGQNVTGAGAGYIYAKKLDGTETTVTTYTASTLTRSIAATFRPSKPFSTFSVDADDKETECTDGNPVSQTITITKAAPVIAFGQMGANGTIDPISISPVMDGLNDHSQGNHYAHYKIYNPGDTISNHTYDMDDEAAENVLQSGYLTFT